MRFGLLSWWLAGDAVDEVFLVADLEVGLFTFAGEVEFEFCAGLSVPEVA